MRLTLGRFPALSGAQIIALLCVVMVDVITVNAGTLTVTTTADSGAGSLRATIAAASAGDTIQFDAALNGQSILLTSDELVIDVNITISGPGPNQLAVTRSSGTFRIFHVFPGRIVRIEGLKISGGNVGSGSGILNNHATLTIENCAVQQNNLGGGIYNDGQGSNASLILLNSTVSGNSAFSAGGGLYNDASADGIANLTITNSIVTDNFCGNTIKFGSGSGGGIHNERGGGAATVTITDSIVSNNRSGGNAAFPYGDGGGIFNNHGEMTIRNSTISGNSTGRSGGGIYNVGSLAITNSTISGNGAIGLHDTERWGYGGAISNHSLMTITNCTLSDNYATNSGGGIIGGGNIKNSTISNNTATVQGGGIAVSRDIQLGHTILKAGSSGANLSHNGGSVVSHGYNLSSDDGGEFLKGTGDQLNTDPMLGPLQNNGGPTLTHDLLAGSPAIDTGDPNFTPPPLNDQRGPTYTRVFNGRIDIGSLEVQPKPPIPTPTPTPSPSPTPAQTLNISTRLRVETGNSVLVGGFIVTGNAPKGVAIRGIGPSLAAFGISDALSDPTLELRAANGALIAQNDNWQDNPAHAAELTALGLALQHPNESGIVATLQPGASYTAILAGNNGGTGVGLVEIYDANQAADSQLANISTRGFVQTGNNVMIGGFILGGGGNSAQVAVRGLGPSLSEFGLSPVLSDPTLELRDNNGALVMSNDDWQENPTHAAQLSAHGLALPNFRDAGIFAIFPPGVFTVILAGSNSGTGFGLVEIYNVP
jgi:hypothetical protein